MKLKLAATVSALAVVVLVAVHTSTLHAQSEPKHLTDVFTSTGEPLVFVANNVERNANEIRLKGNVQIQLRPQSAIDPVMVLHADEATYSLKTDEIIPAGNVRVTIEKSK